MRKVMRQVSAEGYAEGSCGRLLRKVLAEGNSRRYADFAESFWGKALRKALRQACGR